MGTRELGTLKQVAAADEDRRVQLAAVDRIGERAALEELAAEALGPEVHRVVRAKIDRLLCEEALAGSEPAGIEAALERIEDLALVEHLAAQAPTPALRARAVARIKDQEALCRIVETNCGKEPARVALAKIDQEPLLGRIARSGASKVTRRLAEEKLAALASERARPLEKERRDRELTALADEAERLATSEDWEAGERRFAALDEAWRRLDPERAHPLRTGVEGARKRFEERRDEVARREAEATRQAEVPAAETSETGAEASAVQEAIDEERRRLDELAEELDRTEALSGPRDPDLMRRTLGELDRRVRDGGFRFLDPAGLLARIETAQKRCEERRTARAEDEARGRRDALERRAALCAELEGLVEAEDRAAAGRRVKELRKIWRELPASPEKEARALEERFRAAGDRFSVRQAAFLEQQEWLRWNNKTLKEELCTAVEALDAEEDLAAVADRVKEAQRRWKELGPAPKADAEALWQRFKAACDRGFERCKPYLEELESRRAEDIERREELCRQAEAHAESTEWKDSAETLKRLQAEWKEAGPIPRKREEELYARFRQTCDRFFERRQAHSAELDESRRGVQAEKERLCERAEALAAEPDRGHTREFRELQAAWKRLGPAPRDVDQALWERFRGSCDRFFAWLDAGRQENLHKKEALCEEVEALVAGTAGDADPTDVTARIAELQRRWNEIGPAPKEDEEAVWERFQGACDELFEARREQGRRETETGISQPS
jgi:hypothetical protein